MKRPRSWLGVINGRPVRFVAYFRHWRSGKIIRASDYGKKAFVFYL